MRLKGSSTQTSQTQHIVDDAGGLDMPQSEAVYGPVNGLRPEQ